ncbi:hypothetical protein J3A83DRAFT_604581 [Scleroderma citrinum]
MVTEPKYSSGSDRANSRTSWTIFKNVLRLWCQDGWLYVLAMIFGGRSWMTVWYVVHYLAMSCTVSPSISAYASSQSQFLHGGMDANVKSVVLYAAHIFGNLPASTICSMRNNACKWSLLGRPYSFEGGWLFFKRTREVVNIDAHCPLEMPSALAEPLLGHFHPHLFHSLRVCLRETTTRPTNDSPPLHNIRIFLDTHTTLVVYKGSRRQLI